jgi:cytochrome P450
MCVLPSFLPCLSHSQLFQTTQGEAVSDKQLRDDLMTMLVAGHETTAALLTWSLFEITKARDEFGDSFLDRARAEVRRRMLI